MTSCQTILEYFSVNKNTDFFLVLFVDIESTQRKYTERATQNTMQEYNTGRCYFE